MLHVDLKRPGAGIITGTETPLLYTVCRIQNLGVDRVTANLQQVLLNLMMRPVVTLPASSASLALDFTNASAVSRRSTGTKLSPAFLASAFAPMRWSLPDAG